MNTANPTLQTKTVLSPIALAGFVVSFIALTLSLIGSFAPAPFGAVRIPVVMLTGFQAILVYGGTFVAPIFLGALGAAMGGYAFTSIDRSNGRQVGHGAAVFSIFMGLLAVIIGGMITFAVLIYPLIWR